MTEKSKLTLLDTNILVYAIDSKSVHHVTCKALVDRALFQEASLCVAPQNLAEFYAVVTDRRRVENPLPPDYACQAIVELMRLPGLIRLPVPLDVTDRWLALLRRHSIISQHSFDAYLVATMLGHGVHRIYTCNTSDFSAFADIQAIAPQTASEDAIRNQ